DQMLLGAKVIVGGAGRDSGLLGDRAHRGLLVAALAEHLQRGLQNQRPGLLALAARFSRIHGQRSLVQRFLSQGSISLFPGRLISEEIGTVLRATAARLTDETPVCLGARRRAG